MGSRIASHAIMFPGMTAGEKDYLCRAAAYVGATMIRIDCPWQVVQPKAPPAPYDWSKIDSSLAAAMKYGLEVVALIAETPKWASSNQGRSYRSYPPTDSLEWARFIRSFVTRYENEVKYYEIWGEANDNGQWLGTAAEYARLYSSAHEMIKYYQPGAKVLMGGLNESKLPWWLYSVVSDPSHPAKDKIDIIDVHVRGAAWYVELLTDAFRTLFSVAGVPNADTLPLWITEFGYCSLPKYQNDPNYRGVSIADGKVKQADYYRRVIPTLLAPGRAERIFVTLRDLPTRDRWACEGLITTAGDGKMEAIGAIKELAAQFQVEQVPA